jgi:hypothetical protein
VSALSSLIREGADPNTRIDDQSLLTYAVAFADPGAETSEVIALLIDRGADPNIVYANAGGPLWHAVVAADLAAVLLLLARGANPNLVHFYPECPETALDMAFSEMDLYSYFLEDARKAAPGRLDSDEWRERISEYEERVSVLPQIISTLEHAGGRTYCELAKAEGISPALLPRAKG